MSDQNRGRLGYTIRQWKTFIFVLVIGLSGLFYHILRNQGIDHSAALYVGFPFLFALGLSLTPKTKSYMGTTMKGLTIVLLLSAPVFMEGFICILMAAPILYSVAAIFAWVFDYSRKKRDKDSSDQIFLPALTVVFAFASLEGTHELLSFERYNQVEYSRVIDQALESTRKNLSVSTIPTESRPLFLRIFPLPKTVSGEGLSVGDEHKLDFEYKKWIFTNTHKGSTIFRVAEVSSNYVRFDIPHDDSYISHYLEWKSSEVFFEELDQGKTKVSWRLAYDRKLDPVWYFGPLQRYAVYLTAKVLTDNTETSRD